MSPSRSTNLFVCIRSAVRHPCDWKACVQTDGFERVTICCAQSFSGRLHFCQRAVISTWRSSAQWTPCSWPRDRSMEVEVVSCELPDAMLFQPLPLPAPPPASPPRKRERKRLAGEGRCVPNIGSGGLMSIQSSAIFSKNLATAPRPRGDHGTQNFHMVNTWNFQVSGENRYAPYNTLQHWNFAQGIMVVANGSGRFATMPATAYPAEAKGSSVPNKHGRSCCCCSASIRLGALRRQC